MNPELRTRIYYEEPINFVKKEKLKQSQMYKRSNQTHPAFKKKK